MAAESARRRKAGRRPDWASWGGAALALASILYGFHLEHGKTTYLLGESAALIVLGGTVGATLVGNQLAIVRGALRRLKDVFFVPAVDERELIEQVVGYAVTARKQGIVALEEELGAIDDPYLAKAIQLAVDGADLQEIQSMLRLEIELAEERAEREAKVFEGAGGYAPTIGIIGAVLGLIMTMRQLNAGTEAIGQGIATAFIATIYGVGLANLVLLPAAGKIKAAAKQETERRELILEGVSSLVEGLNPKLIRMKLEAYVHTPSSKDGKAKQEDPAPAPQKVA